ncbi:MAG TPA: DUF2336 domain-containing protein [Dongiaceae bacterium]
MSEPFDIPALMAAARDRTPAGRGRLFGLLGRLFLARGAPLPEPERRGFAELLALLRSQTDVETRLELAYATAESPEAPRELALLLAEDEIEIAALVLFGARALGAADLLALAEDHDRALVIAGRRFLPMMISDSLMRRGDAELARALLKNETVRFSIPALAEAIELARDDEDLQSRIAERSELLEDMGLEMAEWAIAAVRERLIERFDIADNALLADFVRDRGDDIEGDAETVAGRPAPDPRFRLAPRLVIECLRRGDISRAEVMLAQMARLPIDRLRRCAERPGGKEMVFIARAIGVGREEFATIYLLWRKAKSDDGAVAAGVLGAALDLFDATPQAEIELEIAAWRSEDLAQTA